MFFASKFYCGLDNLSYSPLYDSSFNNSDRVSPLHYLVESIYFIVSLIPSVFVNLTTNNINFNLRYSELSPVDATLDADYKLLEKVISNF